MIFATKKFVSLQLSPSYSFKEVSTSKIFVCSLFSVGRWNTCKVGSRIGLHRGSGLFGLGFGQRCCSGDKNWKWAKNEGELVGNCSQAYFEPNPGHWQVEQGPETFLEPIWNTMKNHKTLQFSDLNRRKHHKDLIQFATF